MTLDVPDSFFANIKKLVDTAIKQVYNRRLKEGDSVAEMIIKTGEMMLNEEMEGFGKDLSSINYEDPDFATLLELRHNAHVFMTFKNHQFVGDLVKLLQDDEGKVRTFADFKALADELGEDYYQHWLKAEYETAISTGQMSARWQDYKRNQDILPSLRYQTVDDDRVRQEHALLDGGTYPIDDDFWDVFYPPNGFRCRCDVIQVADGKIEVSSSPDIPKSFMQNVGKSNRIATEDHPYFKGFTKQQKESLKNQVASLINRPSNMAKYGVDINPLFWRFVRHKPKVSFRKNYKGSRYNANKPEVQIATGARFQRSKVYQEKIIYHELGHAAHIQRKLVDFADSTDELDAAFAKCKDLIKGKEKQINDALTALNQAISFKAHDWEYKGMNKYDWHEEIGAAWDTLQALTKGKYGFGHSKKYYKRKNFDKFEWFAHASENAFRGNTVFQEVMPEVYNEMVKYIRSVEL
ncbi:MAG: phage minor head protein [Bacteroidota bacterium]